MMEPHKGFVDQASADAQHIQILYDIHQFVRCDKCDTPCDPNGKCWECGEQNKPDLNQWAFTSAELKQIYHSLFLRWSMNEDLVGFLRRTSLGDLTDDEIVLLAEKLEGSK